VSREMTCQANTKRVRGKVELGSFAMEKGLTSPLLKSFEKESLEQALCHGTSGILF